MTTQEQAYRYEASRSGLRWLLCLFTCNRPKLLANAIRSIEKFTPTTFDLRIYDDGNDDSGIMAATSRTWSRARCERYERREGQSGLYGGFYRNMRRALEYAIAEGYDRVLFFEDDEQFVAPLKTAAIENIFHNCWDAVQVNPLFLRRAYPYRGKLQWNQAANAYRTERAFNTTAIWNMDLVKLKRFTFIDEFPDGLPANSGWWLKQGFRLYQMGQPCAVVVPPGLTSVNVYGIPAKDPAQYLPFQEHVTEEPGLVWHQPKFRRRLYELCAETLKQEREWGAWYWVQGVEPLQSHMDWKPGVPPTGWRSKLPWWMVEARHFHLRHYLAYRELSKRLETERGSKFEQSMDVTVSTYHGAGR